MVKDKKKLSKQVTYFPPVVTVVGHVDHGKTTLLDTIRKSNIAAREHGGITQGIGASRIATMHDGVMRDITFIDTPGHEAFSQMRSRGAQAADIGLLIVSLADGVMPQTKESIQLLKDAKTPFIVVFTKSDLPHTSIEKIKQQLAKEGLLLEGLGGEISFIEVSAKTGKNIQELLDLILLVWDMQEGPKAQESSKENFAAVVIESKMDPRVGPKATLVIKKGSVAVKEMVQAEAILGKVRILFNTQGKPVQSATVGDAVEILGFEKVPAIGITVYKRGEAPVVKEPAVTMAMPAAPMGKLHREKNSLSLILCADTLGSLEAIVQALPKEVQLLQEKVGEISEADVLLAKSTGSLVLGFNVKIREQVSRLASVEKVLMKNYTLIYELLDEVHDVLEGKALALEEKVFGKAKIQAVFPFDKTKVAGVLVLEGRVAKGDKVRLMRGEMVVGESTISSLRHGKESTSKVEKGQEAGLVFPSFVDFTIGDMVICHG